MKLLNSSRNRAAAAALITKVWGIAISNQMRQSARLLVAVTSLGSLVSVPALAHAQSYDLAADWSITANPTGAWTYGRNPRQLSCLFPMPPPKRRGHFFAFDRGVLPLRPR
jgi:hypothetical protein